MNQNKHTEIRPGTYILASEYFYNYYHYSSNHVKYNRNTNQIKQIYWYSRSPFNILLDLFPNDYVNLLGLTLEFWEEQTDDENFARKESILL
jgi:hypothetical protein